MKVKKVRLYAFDYSVFDRADIRDCIGGIIGSMLVLRRSQALENWRRMKHILENRKNIRQYFCKNLGRYFIPKYVGIHNDKKNILFETIFDDLGELKNLSVFIKMDIEGAEYKTLPKLLPYFDKINGLVVEFHGLDNIDDFEMVMELFSKDFYVGHIHANNAADISYETGLPLLLEIMFINKMSVTDVKPSLKKYPLGGLDFPNIKKRKDIEFDFQEEKSLT